MRGRPRFFCEHCGAEVPKDAKHCPQCGRSFASVLCPSCGFAGNPDLFTGGCPVCGYSAPPAPETGKESPPKTAPAGALPWWVYLLTALALLALCGALYLRGI